MTLDTRLRTRLTSAVDDTTVPPGLAAAVMTGGRRRRRRRAAAGIALATAAVVSGAVLLPDGGPAATTDAQVADGDNRASMAGLQWARSLPMGPDARLPFFGEGGLWAAGQVVRVPPTVNQSIAPREVAGGWLVFVGEGESDLALAVLSVDGSLRRLPAETYVNGMGDARVVVSDDGSVAALGHWMVDLDAMRLTELPHAAQADEKDGYYSALRVIGFTDQGLVYEGAPFDEGFGTTWLLTDDGSAANIAPPAGSHIPDGGPADVALAFDYADDGSDTCATSYALEAGSWVEDGYGCMGRSLDEALVVSPDRQWLITDDLPEVWDLRAGAYVHVDVPRDVVRGWGEGWLGRAVWEDDDTFLIPVADRWSGASNGSFHQTTQVVRCFVPTGTCERAGDEQRHEVTYTWSGSTELKFAI